MVKVIALRSFDHYGSKRRNEIFECTKDVARDLSEKGLVEELNSHVASAAGKPSSASPAARASQKQTFSESESGDSQKKKPSLLNRVFGKKEA